MANALQRRWFGSWRWWLQGMAALAIAAPAATAVARPDDQTQVLQQPYDFPLAPGEQDLQFDQFDDQGGARVLQSVTVDLETTIRANVTVENDSTLPAPELALNLTGTMMVDLEHINQFIGIESTFDGPMDGVAPSDGVPGSGPDFYDFGFIQLTGTDSATKTRSDPEGLDVFVGGGSVTAHLLGSGGFAATGTTEWTQVVTNFGASGTVTVTYTYKWVEAACCFTDGMCSDLTPPDCAAAGGVWSGVGTDCATFACPQPGACCLPDGTCRQETIIGGDTCFSDGGDYQGDDTSCATASCPAGACCFDDGSCTDASEPDCISAGGTWSGLGTDCATFA
ncbi:MAG: choice-of-anchor E domain-containing protein, partial [Phycisphaerales bacterium]|nr:choice-of-anchor E domain-containing protein [Phycisphaerales bacterium]